MFVDGFIDTFADAGRLGEEEAFFEQSRHGGIDEAGFDGEDGDARFGQTAAQPLQEDGYCSFGGAVDVVAGSATVACHGCDDGYAAMALLFEIVGEDGQEGNDACEVGVKLFEGFSDALLAELLVSECAVGDEDNVEASEGVDGILDHVLVLIEVVEVELVGLNTSGASYLKVVFDGCEFFGVASHEVEVSVIFGEIPGCFVCDGRSGSYDEYFFSGHG